MRELQAMKQLYKGFAFGMVLQIAVGPVCVFVFNQANANGFAAALAVVSAVTLVDALYVALAAFGFAAFLEKPRAKKTVRYLGSAVVLIFGLDILFGAFGLGFLPSTGASLKASAAAFGPFAAALILTASNPLTIVFWAGLFAVRAKNEKESRTMLLLYSAGAVAATPFFLSGVSLLGVLAKSFAPAEAVVFLNALAGAVLVFFGLKMALRARD